MSNIIFQLILSFFTFSVISASPYDLPFVHHKTLLPSHWHQSRLADPAHTFELSIAVSKDSHVAEILYNISTPGHAQYGSHLTQVEAQTLLSPDATSSKEILSWLVRGNVVPSNIKVDGHWIRFKTTVANADTMLKAKFTWYTNSQTKKEVLRTLAYSVPRPLHSKISLISPTTRFCSMNMEAMSHHTEVRSVHNAEQSLNNRAAGIDPTCNRTITPDCIRTLYNVPSNLSLSTSRGLGVYGSQNQVAKYADLKLFVKSVDPKSAATNFTILSVNGGPTAQSTPDNDQEVNFDIQYASAIWSGTTPLPTVQYSIGGQGPIQPELGNVPGDGIEPWLQWLDFLLALPDSQLPHTITTSFGENEQSLPSGYAQQVCNQFGALGARGVSMLAASGDSGPGSACVTNDGTNATRFTPIFPGSCPYVTAVGGTKGVNPEVATVFSAGGFSDKFPRPAYQDQVVPAYLKTLGNQFNGLFNTSGRGFPDIASQSFNLTYASTESEVAGFAGTSAGAPTVAGLIGTMNAALIAQNKAPLGFLNPWLYAGGAAGMTDIVLGGSRGCSGVNPFSNQPIPAMFDPRKVANAGWNATVGWDPVTGMGTMNMGKLMEIAMAGKATKRR